VTGSTKTGLIVQIWFFFTNTKLHEHTIKFHNQSHPVLSGLLFLAIFPKVTLRVVWNLNRDLANHELVVCGCTTLQCWIMTCTVNLLSFYSVLSPEWPITWCGSTLSLPDKFYLIKPFSTYHPRHHPLFSLPDTVNLSY